MADGVASGTTATATRISAPHLSMRISCSASRTTDPAPVSPSPRRAIGPARASLAVVAPIRLRPYTRDAADQPGVLLPRPRRDLRSSPAAAKPASNVLSAASVKRRSEPAFASVNTPRVPAAPIRGTAIIERRSSAQQTNGLFALRLEAPTHRVPPRMRSRIG